ncbi:unnamed protein product [Haemonchus placei]|uniref:Uncharacterized protein n=1 Tax=Haemonchus placei TaxID=6290 RepID=A0A158QLQ4_HAEPC|nr:unnamed protein product [Haemonchus placei]
MIKGLTQARLVKGRAATSYSWQNNTVQNSNNQSYTERLLSPRLPGSARLGMTLSAPLRRRSNVAASPPRFSAMGGEDELILTSATTSITTTAPIRIPVSLRQQTSSRFSAPDNQFHTADLANERQFVIDDLTIRSQSSYELLKHVAAEIISLSKVGDHASRMFLARWDNAYRCRGAG